MAIASQQYNVGGILLSRPFKVRRLGHFGFNAVKVTEGLEFYNGLLGFKISDDAIIRTSLEGIIENCNLSTERILDCSIASLKGQPLSHCFASDKREEIDRIVQRVMHGEAVAHYEAVAVRGNGHTIEMALSFSPIKNAAGEIIGLSVIGRDVTHQNRLARERDKQA